MGSLIQLNDLKARANATPAPIREVATPPVIEQLRQRLLSGNYADSIDVKLAIVGELVYHTYKELMKRRYL